MRSLLLTLSLSLCAGCGYRAQEKSTFAPLQGASATLSVAYVKGDKNGLLTERLIEALVTSGRFHYVNQGGMLHLEGEILSENFDSIGFQYDRDPLSGMRKERLIPNEGRCEVVVRFRLTDGREGSLLYPPFEISATSDYDFVDPDSLQDLSFTTPSGELQSSLFFSLGQLDSRYGAQEAARASTYAILAERALLALSHLPLKEHADGSAAHL